MYKEDELWVWLDARVSLSHDFQEQKGILHVKASLSDLHHVPKNFPTPHDFWTDCPSPLNMSLDTNMGFPSLQSAKTCTTTNRNILFN